MIVCVEVCLMVAQWNIIVMFHFLSPMNMGELLHMVDDNGVDICCFKCTVSINQGSFAYG